ncbi:MULTISPECIES: diguanylate cyclase [unclassified Paenibacillus]|uniref:GGDEF domain-containing protein n=1 Tax=unclassified Paenibacillus TaxID=185978 RepID=UPI001AE69462|nr:MULTISPECIES: diguanylate cyclase [unclassified Paenibacillus]MBP1153687.1 diguanylate cyclase [Paenibacillus sp. PvP091]MBP1170928.1 diguanylate cyclase [Paenibacillus sp. PvR098]MBP2441956.1 diguanylate cyclase [Paenibacillus sp. PvP052]
MRDGLFYTIQDIIANFAILTAFLFTTSLVIFKKRNLGETPTFFEKIKIGFVGGLLGILLMAFKVNFENTILDFRHLAIILSAIGGGLYSSLIAGLIISVMRLFAFGSITPNTLVAAANTFVVSLGVGMICSMYFSYWKKWLYSLLIANVLTSIVFFINFGKQGLDPAVLFIFMMFIGGVFAAYLSLFLAKAKSYSLRMEKEATFDFLTELNNHRTFDTVFNTSLKNAIEKNEYLTLMLVDIDYFKKVNDTYGHPNGDYLLKQVGELLKNTSRNFDVISRIGGEEFSILLFDCPHQHALIIAERIRLAVQDHSFVLNDGTTIKITISIGVASLSKNNRDDMIEQADVALYKAKHNGRNQVCSI